MTKEIKRGKYTLYHSVIDGDFGPENSFKLVFTKHNGERIIMPFYPPLKVHNTGMSDPIELDTYTAQEYEQILDSEIKNFERHYAKKIAMTDI